MICNSSGELLLRAIFRLYKQVVYVYFADTTETLAINYETRQGNLSDIRACNVAFENAIGYKGRKDYINSKHVFNTSLENSRRKNL